MEVNASPARRASGSCPINGINQGTAEGSPITLAPVIANRSQLGFEVRRFCHASAEVESSLRIKAPAAADERRDPASAISWSTARAPGDPSKAPDQAAANRHSG